MKQAILILAHKNFNTLIDIINFFDDSFSIYIHIDKKAKIDSQTKKEIASSKNLKLLSFKYNVNWGGTKVLLAHILLAEEAIKDTEISYFHIITGQDYPIKNISHFKKLTNEPNPVDYLEYFKIPTKQWLKGGMYRVDYYNFYDLLNARKNNKLLIHKLVRLQEILKIKRPFSKDKIPNLFGGSAFWSLTRETLQYVVDYTNQDGYLLRRLKYTLAPDEIYFQTVIMNSLYAENIVNDNRRYIDHTTNRGGGPPAVLDESDFKNIVRSNKLFARKFDSPRSDKLRQMLNEKVLYHKDS